MTRSKILNRCRILLMKHSPNLYVKLARLAARRMFRAERSYLAGGVKADSDSPSVLHFCYNRCGSRFVSSLVQRMVGPKGIQHLDFARFFTHTDRARIRDLDDAAFVEQHLRATGFHYGPFYQFTEGLESLDGYRTILTLRDPRDVLTSRYFSQAFAHTLFSKENVERRRRVQAMTVDEFVLEQVGELKERYGRYHEMLVGKEGVLVLPYEKMVGDFEGWLGDLSAFLDVDPNAPVVKEILAETSFSVRKEDKYSHKRSVKPGNHRKKLKPETIERLNEDLSEILAQYGYGVEL